MFCWFVRPTHNALSHADAARIRNYSWAALGTGVFLLLVAVIGAIYVRLDGLSNSAPEVTRYADACGYIGAFFVTVQFLPQIRETYR